MRNVLRIVLCLVIAVTSWTSTLPAHAYTISVSCFNNVFQSPGRPFGNVDCQYVWHVGGYSFNNRGSWSAQLYHETSPWYFPVTKTLLHQIQRPLFAFADQTGPNSNHVWIACTNQTGIHGSDMQGQLYKFVIQGTGSGYWSPQELQVDGDSTIVNEPLVTCP